MKYKIVQTSKFKKDLKRAIKQGKNLAELQKVINLLASGQNLPIKNRDHALKGNYSHCRECHIAPDWLLIYEIIHDELFLYLTRLGSHSELLGM